MQDYEVIAKTLVEEATALNDQLIGRIKNELNAAFQLGQAKAKNVTAHVTVHQAPKEPDRQETTVEKNGGVEEAPKKKPGRKKLFS